MTKQNAQAKILFLAKIEREKSLEFYEFFSEKNAIFGVIAKKERAFLDEIFAESNENLSENAESSEFLNAESNDFLNKNAESTQILLPSALPQNIAEELQNEMGAVDLKSLNILAIGVESHHLKTCDFLIKKAQELGANLKIIDILYQLQALSYNHHIALLQGESPKENTNPANPNANQNPANPPQITDLLNQSPLFAEIKTAFDSFERFYAETKGIVSKLEKGDLSKEELVKFLQKLRF
ncbi:hypothetical protein ACWIUD_11190 [Helicobacter sp. 23-1044]